MLRLRHMDIALYSAIAVVFVIGVVKLFFPLLIVDVVVLV